MNSKITYHQQISYCGKPQCRKCREGKGHGPYWYAYQTTNGHTTRTYIGKNLPPGVQASLAVAPVSPVMAASTPETGEAASPTSDPAGNAVRIFALGQYRIERRNQRQWQTVTEPAWQQQRVRSLLALLIASPERRVSRARAIELLWPGSDAEAGTANLNRTLHALRQLLENGRPTRQTARSQSRLLRSEGDWLILAGQSQVWLDADAFESLLSAPTPSLTVDDASSRELLLREAAELYGGDFLPEERRAEWAVPRRQALRRRWIGLLLELADIYIASDSYTSALDVLDQLLATDPSHEAAVRRFIYVLASLKRRGEALRAYNRLTEILRQEYNTAPSDDTRLLYEAVRQGGEIPPFLRIPRAPALPSSPSAPAQLGAQMTPASAEAPDTSADISAMPVVDAASARDTLADIAAVQFGRSHRKPLIGREMELETLYSMLLDVEQRTAAQDMPRRSHVLPLDTQRHSQCMVLMGEAGIGKTRLAEEMSREALRRGWSVIWSRVYQQESGIPYHLWTEVLRRAISSAGLIPALPRPAALRALRPANHQGSELTRQPSGRDSSPFTETDVLDQESEADQSMSYRLQPLSPLLPELASIYPSPAFSSLTPEQEELRLWEAAREVLLAAGKSSPLLIVLDDVQWADVSSGRLLGYLARHIFGQPVLLLATCRDTELPPQHQLRTLIAHMHREHTVTTLTVNPLSSEEIGRLVSDLPEPLVRRIQEQAAGNPFFAEELARSTPPTMPDTVAAALDHRMNRLSRPCQQMLENAAVLGGSFEFPTLYGMSSSTDEDAILDLLEEALQSGVITEEGTGIRVTYHFWHPLLVSHLYERISAIRRARLHLRAAAILERTHEERLGEVAATIVHHLVMGGAEPERIAHYAELAGDRAYALSAYAEARRHYQLALESLGLSLSTIAAYAESMRLQENGPISLAIAARSPHMPKTTVPISNVHLLNLLELLAECTMIRGNFEDARHLYEYILALRREHLHLFVALDNQDISDDVQYEIQKEALLWGEIGWTWRYTGDSVRARRCCERGEQVLRVAAIVAGPAWARLRMQQGSLFWQEGRYEEAGRATQESLAFFASQQKMTPVSRSARTTRIQRTLEGDPVDLGVAHRLLAALADAEGRAAEALDHLNAALFIFEQADHKRRIAHVAHDLSYVYIKKGAFEQAHASLRRALNLAERLGDDPLIAVVYSNQGELAAAGGDLEEAEIWYRRSLALAEQFNDREYISRWNTRLAAVLRAQDRLDEAATCTLRALSLGRAMRNNPCTGSALVALSNLRIAQARASRNLPTVTKRLLTHAGQNARRALALPGLEAETHVQADLALAHIALLLGDHHAPEQLAQVIEQAHLYELTLIETQARHLAETS